MANRIISIELHIQVLSIVQLLGLVICLNAAAKISHRAQGLGSVASRWHALVTCNNNDTSVSGLPSDGKNGETPTTVSQLPVNYSEGDLESADCMPPPTNIQLTSTMSPYHKRQAFGMQNQTSAEICTACMLVLYSYYAQVEREFCSFNDMIH